MKSYTTAPSALFAVTDFQDVLKLKIVESSEITGYIKAKTVIDEESPSSNRIAQHQAYFERIYLTPNGEPTSPAIFLEIEAARAFAIKNLEAEIKFKQKDLSDLQQKLISHQQHNQPS